MCCNIIYSSNKFSNKALNKRNKKGSSMTNYPVPTLKDIALSKVALLLHNDEERNQLSECAQRDSLEWKQTFNDKLPKLFLPISLHDELGAIIKRVYLLLKKFYVLHQHFSIFLCDECDCMKEITQSSHFSKFWTTEAFCSEEKIASYLMRDRSLSAAFRFMLTCEYFVNNNTRSQWQHMQHLIKSRLFNRGDPERIKQKAKNLMPEECSTLRGLCRKWSIKSSSTSE